MTVTTTPTETTLTALDRCDRCNAQAYVVIRMGNGLDLLFCAHHDRENRPALLAKGATVVTDETARLS